MVSKNERGPVVVRLTAGLALRQAASTYRFVCPAAWGDSDALPGYGLPNGPAVLLSSKGLLLMRDDGSVAQHPDAGAQGTPIDIVALAGKLYVLRVRGTGSEIIEVDQDRVHSVWSDATLWTTLAAGDDFLAVARLSDDDRLEQLRLSPSGMQLDSARAAAPSGAVAVSARALGKDLFLNVAWSGGRQLGALSASGFNVVQRASAAIAGPVQAPDGTRYIALDSALSRMAADGALTPVPTTTPIDCLGRYADALYACTREGIQSLGESGLGELSFDLAQLAPPDLSGLAAEPASACDLQWQHFRFDLLSLGITPLDPSTAGGGGQAAGSPADMPAPAGQPAPSPAGAAAAPVAGHPGGCGCTLPKHDRLGTSGWPWIACAALCLRRRQRRAPSHPRAAARCAARGS